MNHLLTLNGDRNQNDGGLMIKKMARLLVLSLFLLMYAPVWSSDWNPQEKQNTSRTELVNSKQTLKESIPELEAFIKTRLDPTDKQGQQKLIQAKMKLISAYQKMGFMEKALALVDENLNELNKPINELLAIQILSQASDFELSMGELYLAEEYILRAKKLQHKKIPPLLSAQLFQRAGNSATLLGKYEASIKDFQISMDFAELAGNRDLLIKSHINQLFPTLQLTVGKPKVVLQQIQEVVSMIPQLSSASLQGNAYITVGVLVFEQMAHFSEQNIREELLRISYQCLSQAKKLAENATNYRQLSVSSGYLAKLYLQQSRFAEAQSLTNMAIFYAQQKQMPEYLYQWYELRGRLLARNGQLDEAIATYQQAVKILAPIRNYIDLGVRSPVRSFENGVKAVYYAYADLLLQKAQQTTDSKQQQDYLYQARDAIESLKAAELENYFKDDCVATLQASQKSLETVSPGILVLYPISLPDRLVLLISSSQGIKQYSIPVTAKELKQHTLSFRRNLQSRPHNRFLYQAGQLYDWMIRPILGDIRHWQVDTLIIVADGLLRTIPFSALHDGQQFLIEQYAIANAPGFKLIDPKPLQWKDNKVLLAGLSEAVQDFSPLPNVPKELSRIESVLLAKELVGDKIVDQEYTLQEMQHKLQSSQYSVVHMATHAQFTGQHNNDFLLTYDDKLTIDKLKSLIGFGRFRDKPIELLTMSACQTALGNERAALGLAGVAIKAGARSALATLWFVDDEATSIAVTDFYQALAGKRLVPIVAQQLDKHSLPINSAQVTNRKAVSKAKALQEVQIAMIKQPRYWHPSYWAPFLLIGNWL